jgi:hypothetical protein
MSTEHQLSKLMAEFIVNTIYGYESGLYRGIVLKSENIELTKQDSFKTWFIEFNVNYFNRAYSSLIKHDDKYITDNFEKMHTIMNHSYICLLNILFKMTVNIISEFDRSDLDVTSYDNYMKSVISQLTFFKEIIEKNLPAMLSHTCKGIDIKTCNPDEPLFYIK